MVLPFGSLTGVIPIDTVPQGRVLEDPSIILAGSGEQRPSEFQRQLHSLIDPRPASAKGNQTRWK